MKRPVVPQSKTRRKFDLTFKKQAVELWLQSGKPAKVVAAELGIQPMRLSTWKKLFANQIPGPKPSAAALAEENASLRQEVEYLRQQRDILKKTLGILSEPPASATNGSRP